MLQYITDNETADTMIVAGGLPSLPVLMNSCIHVSHFTVERGNITCPPTAPVLSTLQTFSPQ